MAPLVAMATMGWFQGAIADDRLKCKAVNGELNVVSTATALPAGPSKMRESSTGRRRAVFTSALTPTPKPNAFSYTDQFSITTNRGVLKSHNVGLFLVANGLFSEIGVIDSSTSTGSFHQRHRCSLHQWQDKRRRCDVQGRCSRRSLCRLVMRTCGPVWKLRHQLARVTSFLCLTAYGRCNVHLRSKRNNQCLSMQTAMAL